MCFWALDRFRTSNGYSVERISPSNVESYLRLARLRLKLWELEALFKLDEARVAWLNRDKNQDIPAKADLPVLRPGGLAAQFNRE